MDDNWFTPGKQVRVIADTNYHGFKEGVIITLLECGVYDSGIGKAYHDEYEMSMFVPIGDVEPA